MLALKVSKRKEYSWKGRVIRAWSGAWKRMERQREEARAEEDARVEYMYE